MSFAGNGNWVATREYSAALSKNLGDLQFKLGKASLSDRPRKLDRSSIDWLRSAACEGNADAMYEIGRCYDEGLGLDVDPITAIKWYEAASRQGHAKAINTLAWCYAKGSGVKKDESASFQLYVRAAQHQLPEAQYNLAVCYSHGRGTARDPIRAVELYTKAAKQRHTTAMCNLAMCLQSGDGCTADPYAALNWLKAASDAGSVMGRRLLARSHFLGIGTPRDEKAAARILGDDVWRLGTSASDGDLCLDAAK
jgi:TPR repeat protein